MDELKCPHCGTELEEDDCYDRSDNGDYIANYCCGHCPNCNKEYQWKEIFDFSNYDELVEV